MTETRIEHVICVSYIGDLVSAATVLPLLASQGQRVAVLADATAAPLLSGDARVAAVRSVRSANAIVWRSVVLAYLLGVRRTRGRVVNLEVYRPRWRFVATCCRWLRLPARRIDLPNLLADNQRSARGEPTVQGHRNDYYALALGGEVPSRPPRLVVDATVCAPALDRLHVVRHGRAPLVIAHLGASNAAKWPPLELVAGLLGRLERTGCVGVIVGAAADASLARRALALLGRDSQVVDACGRLDLREFAALASQAQLFVGGDSGPLKVAEAVGVPTVSFWHAHQPSPEFGGPRGPGHATLPTTATLDEATSAARALLPR